MRIRQVLAPILMAFAAAGLLLSPAPAAAASSSNTVKVLLSEWLVQPRPKTASAGKVRFVVHNAGSEQHELMIMRGDDPKMLTTKPDGSVDEHMMSDDTVGHIMGIKSKQTKSKTFRLAPGKYILLCNLVDDMGDVHFAKGMYSTLRVT